MASQVRALIDGMTACPFKFNVSGLGGAAKGGHQKLSICLIGIINSPFLYRLMSIYISEQQFDMLIESLDL